MARMSWIKYKIANHYDKKGEEINDVPTHQLDLQCIKDDVVQKYLQNQRFVKAKQKQRQIRNKAISVNNRRVNDEMAKISDFIDSKGSVAIEIGKKRKFLLSFE